ncbi:hypothetical protein MtrunA17_Chr4g0012601 [Medicago truncatula]|uniref:Transmembrane protein, putative n=1 Tax=Medicago truncatula TaxID=3880 RepID=A0A072UTF8_MEDTR|nr:transmembrane protein, putative [Medicago truncatula]RHN59372.1 hypothetical protein MtrunA17_Chr4g0012601 [Medicago truncatula]
MPWNVNHSTVEGLCPGMPCHSTVGGLCPGMRSHSTRWKWCYLDVVVVVVINGEVVIVNLLSIDVVVVVVIDGEVVIVNVVVD